MFGSWVMKIWILRTQYSGLILCIAQPILDCFHRHCIKYGNARRSYTYKCSFLVFHWFFRWSKYLSLLLNLQIPFLASGDAVATAKKTPRIKTGRYFIFVWMVTLRWFSINRNWNLALTFKSLSHLIFHHVYLCPAPISYKRLNMIYYMTYTDKDWIA